jgi:ketosteroid isomerase-like protein
MPSKGGMSRNERLMARFVEIIGSNDLDALGEVLHEDFVQEIPQSGEVVRGIDNYKAILAHYPGQAETPIEGTRVRAVEKEPHYVMTPTFSVERVHGQSGQSRGNIHPSLS